MKRTASVVFAVILLAALLSACSEKAYRINDIIDLKDEQPVSIVVRFDDPSFEPVEINNNDDIDMIMSKLTAQSYKKVSSNAPMPLGNTSCEMRYSDGSNVKFGAVYVKDWNGNLFQANSNELTALLESFKQDG
nr:hypothetical protein [Clostridia bacterium]